MFEAHVVHHIPGRMRIRVPFLKGASAYAQQINEVLLPVEGMRQVDFSPITGSVLLHYDPEKHEDFSKGLAEYILRTMGVSLVLAMTDGPASSAKDSDVLVAPVNSDTEAGREIKQFFSRINKEIRTATSDAFDLKTALPVGLGIYALLKLGSAMTTPLWVTLGIFSFTSFAILNPVSVTVHPNPEQPRSAKRRKTRRKPKTSS